MRIKYSLYNYVLKNIFRPIGLFLDADIGPHVCMAI